VKNLFKKIPDKNVSSSFAMKKPGFKSGYGIRIRIDIAGSGSALRSMRIRNTAWYCDPHIGEAPCYHMLCYRVPLNQLAEKGRDATFWRVWEQLYLALSAQVVRTLYLPDDLIFLLTLPQKET